MACCEKRWDCKTIACRKIVALNGTKGSGKSYFCNRLVEISKEKEEEYGRKIIMKLPFASMLKLIAFKHFDIFFEKDREALLEYCKIYNKVYDFGYNCDCNTIRNYYPDITRNIMTFETFTLTIKDVIKNVLITTINKFISNLKRVYELNIKLRRRAIDPTLEMMGKYGSYLDFGEETYFLHNLNSLPSEFKSLYIAYINYMAGISNKKNKIRDYYARIFLQMFGTELARDLIHKDIWVMSVFNVLSDMLFSDDFGVVDIIVIDDLRFLNELYALETIFKLLCSQVIPIGIVKEEKLDKDKEEEEFFISRHKSEEEARQVFHSVDIQIENKFKGDDFDDIIKEILKRPV